MGIGTSFDRGFDEIFTTFDFRLLIEQKINRTLLYEIDLFDKKKITKKKLINIIKKEFLITLEQLEIFYKKYDKSLWPKKLDNHNKNIYENSIKEKKILLENPEAIIKKIKSIPAGVYWLTLGKIKYKDINYYIQRAKSAIIWRYKNLVEKQRIWPFLLLDHYQVLFNELLANLYKKISDIKKSNWHIHMHIMDLHDARSASRFLHVCMRYRFFFSWLIQRLQGKTRHRFVYSSSLMYIDRCLKKLLLHMEKEGILDDTLILITADHGSDYAESPRKKLHISGRNHYENIDIPMIVHPNITKTIKRNICDSMGVTASFLDLLDVPLDKSYKGQSIFDKGKDFVISESAGRGNADLNRKNLFFTITTLDHKLMVMLEGKTITINKFYDLRNDPYELKNLFDNKKNISNVLLKKLLKKLYSERKNIFKIRGIKNLDAYFKQIKI